MATLAANLKTTARAMSKRLVASYVLDWVAITIIAAIDIGVAFVTPHYHNFSIVDLAISYPNVDQTISGVALAFIAGVIPAVIIVLVVVGFVPGLSSWRSMPLESLVRWKLWECNVGLLGLAMAHVLSQLVVQGLKNAVGKPRPNMLARCLPDVDNIADYRVGGYGQAIAPGWILVNQRACTQTDSSTMDEGFRSFPSGHAAGLLYLSLFLAAKFAIWVPLLPPGGARSSQHGRPALLRDQAAAAPVWLTILVLFPLGLAAYVTATRFFDYYHFGFDLIAGSVIGLLAGYFSFRWYHSPLGRGGGWAWGPRSKERAFGPAAGADGYVVDEAEAGHGEYANGYSNGGYGSGVPLQSTAAAPAGLGPARHGDLEQGLGGAGSGLASTPAPAPSTATVTGGPYDSSASRPAAEPSTWPQA